MAVACFDPSPAGMGRHTDSCRTRCNGQPRSKVAYLGTHTSWFVHVDPRTIDVHTSIRVIEEFELIGPIILYVGTEPI